ncbi:hypothetical protein [Achromobacter piechaudii]|uniref:hypothetical protein n=1 Tax=Achromobacter piechaudii TaxID=72556 RepID=UPI001581A300|nr:hypothetical protein [Achromobacter piechaudii]
MRVDKNQINNDIVLTDRLDLYGQAAGNISVLQGGELRLYGQCSRDITVTAGGIAIIYGMVVGSVVNDGGNVEVLGAIIGSLRTISGSTSVNPNASILGGRE